MLAFKFMTLAQLLFHLFASLFINLASFMYPGQPLESAFDLNFRLRFRLTIAKEFKLFLTCLLHSRLQTKTSVKFNLTHYHNLVIKTVIT